MATRFSARICAIAAAASALALFAGSAAFRAGTAPARAPAPHIAELTASSTTSLVWAVRPADLLACHTLGSVIRRVQRASARELPLSLVVVDGDLEWGATFLRAERVRGTVRILTWDEFRSRFGTQRVPSILVLNNGQVTAVVKPAPDDSVKTSLLRALR